MDVSLLVGLVAFLFFVLFFVENLKASDIWTLGLYRFNPYQNFIWKLTGKATRFLLVNFFVSMFVLFVGGWLYTVAPIVSGVFFAILLVLVILGWPKRKVVG